MSSSSYTLLRGGKIYDPQNGVDGVAGDLLLAHGRIQKAPKRHTAPDKVIDLSGHIVMPGGIDIHTHIAGGKLNLARVLMSEQQALHPVPGDSLRRPGSGLVTPSAALTGYRYTELGYTACFEPAVLPFNARQVHMEFADTPLIDKGCYVLLGNDDYLLRQLAARRDPQHLEDYLAWMVQATGALAVKVVNPGGINAFKFNQRSLDLDEPNRAYGVTPRQVLLALASAAHARGLAHPLHIHGCNLGIPGGIDTTLRTVQALEGLPAHMTHVQFHCYGKEGRRGFSSGATRLAELVNSQENVSVDIGHIQFGQTVSTSGDSMHQYDAGHHAAHPRKWVCMDIECDAGCGVVPFRYRHHSFVNALQWVIGLELFLLLKDPWRVFLSTDHPNGAPFESYPHLIRLLMDSSFRDDMLRTIHPEAARMSALPGLRREYSLYEIAIITRAGPARSLGLRDYGHLGPGATADITVYKPQRNQERMFARPAYVFKDGRLVARNGRLTALSQGRTHRAHPPFDPSIRRALRPYFERHMSMRLEHFELAAEEIENGGAS